MEAQVAQGSDVLLSDCSTDEVVDDNLGEYLASQARKLEALEKKIHQLKLEANQVKCPNDYVKIHQELAKTYFEIASIYKYSFLAPFGEPLHDTDLLLTDVPARHNGWLPLWLGLCP